jgi:hypothetical protein
LKVKDAWFILTDLGSLPVAISAYKQRMGIEEMFPDYKTGGYNLEGNGLVVLHSNDNQAFCSIDKLALYS